MDCKTGFYLFLIHIETETLGKYLIKIIKLVQFETEFKDHYHSSSETSKASSYHDAETI